MRVETSFLKAGITIVLMSVFVALGVWQLNRATEKSLMREAALARSDMPSIVIGADRLETGSSRFRSATASGEYLDRYQIYIDNKVHQGRAGFHVVTPLLLTGTDVAVLVNRGWAPWRSERETSPHIAASPGQRTVRGQLVEPTRHAITFETRDDEQGFEPVWQNHDLEKYEELTGLSVQGLILRLAPGEEDAAELVREWPAYTDTWVERHRAYAFQWFGLAVTLFCIFAALSLKRR